MKTNFKILMSFVAMMLVSASLWAQNSFKGTVVDAETGETIPGASVMEQGTANGTSTDINGNFILSLPLKGNLVISFLGYTDRVVAFDAKKGTNLGKIKLSLSAQNLDEIVVIGSGVVDFVKDRQTPIAATTISALTIQEKVGNQEFPEILSKTPSVYATKGSGGFGDSRINVRGFDQTNVAVIINGQPVNDMENGRVFWSNWAGLSDVASAVQVQRGLGASKLAVPSVGGTINVLTKSSDKEQGGFFKTSFGNDNYLKTVVGYNTGISEKGWSASFLLGRTTGDGYINGAEFEGYSYLASVGYKLSEKHSFNFNITGAAQWHNQRYTRLSIKDAKDWGGKDFRRFNADWGYRDGKGYTLQKNFYNKPIASLNWDWKINDKWELSSVLYGSWGRGGGSRPIGNTIITKFNSKDINAGKAPYRDANTGLLLFDKIIKNNQSGTPFTGEGAYEGLVLGSQEYKANGLNTNSIIQGSSINSHDWYGAISNLKYENENWTFGTGIDLRTYRGYHYRNINDLLGLDGYYYHRYSDLNRHKIEENIHLRDGVIVAETYKNGIFDDTGLYGQKIGYYNVGDVKWGGINFMSEYKSDKLSGVLQAGLSNQIYKRIDYFRYIDINSDTKNILGGFAKGGINYNINEEHNVFFNSGYISRQPNFNAVFPDNKNIIDENVKNEEIISYELGYGLKTYYIDASLNLYSTTWTNRSFKRSVPLEDGRDGYANFTGVEQRHQGIELETRIRPLDWLKVTGMLSIGNWIYTKDIKANLFNSNQQNLNKDVTLYLKDTKVGDVAQTTASLGVEAKPYKKLVLDASWRYANNLYGSFDVSKDKSFLKANNKGPIKLPAYHLFDFGAGYKFDLGKGMNLALRLNVNNVLDTEYISESTSNFYAKEGSKTYKGIDVNNRVWFGFGRTWNISATLRF